MTRFTVTPLHASLGAEIAGLDLGAPLAADTKERLEAALAEHLVLVFRGQHFTPEGFLAAATAFGEPMAQHYAQHHLPELPIIGRIWHRNGQGAAEMWHTDHTNRERPPKATLLYGVEIPSAGGDTSIANMRAAYAGLPAAEQRRVEGLRTLNSLDEHIRDILPEDREKYGSPVAHPMVRSHPVHGSRALYFHISKAFRIEGMEPAESKACMQQLLDRTIRPEIVYRHRWRPGDLCVIDNRATMHRAHADYDAAESRVLWRIIVEGDRPYLA